jgi:transposase-like protein
MTPTKCPYCKSPSAIWRGWRRTRHAKKHMRKCSRCGRKFTPDDGFLRMRFSPDIIRKAVKLYQKGRSSSEVRRILRNQDGLGVSRWTIIKWARRFGEK